MSNEKRILKVGDIAPDFTLKDQKGNEFRLSKFKGKKVLLSFHPLAWTKVCENQMVALEKKQEIFEQLNTIAVGISVDSTYSKDAWATAIGVKKTRLLADFWPHGEVAKMYGIFREKDGFSERANIIVDENQRVQFIRVYEISQLPDFNDVMEILRSK